MTRKQFITRTPEDVPCLVVELRELILAQPAELIAALPATHMIAT